MTIEVGLTIIGMAGSVFAGFVLVILFLVRQAAKFGVLETLVHQHDKRIDKMLDYMMRRAQSEVLQRHMGKYESPLQLTEEVKQWYRDKADELREFYRTVGHSFTNKELFLEIDHRFGPWILENVCVPYGLIAGSCIEAAIAVASEGHAEAAHGQEAAYGQ